MGLNAFVFCDCWDRGRTRPVPRTVGEVEILPGGDLDCVSSDPAVQARFERWRQRACRHEDGYAASVDLANIAQCHQQQRQHTGAQSIEARAETAVDFPRAIEHTTGD